MFTSIVTTGEKYTEDMYDNGIIVANKGDLKTYQKVLAIGSSVRGIEVGDQVMVNIANYAVMQYDPNSVKQDMGMNKVKGFNFHWIQIEDEEGTPQDCLLLNDRDILFAFEGEEVQGTKNTIITGESKLILN